MKKMKKLLLSLCVLGSLATVSLTQNVYAAPEVSTLSPSEQQSIYQEVKKSNTYKDLPKDLRDLIKPETITGLSANHADPANNDLTLVFDDKEKGLLMHLFKADGQSYTIVRRNKATKDDIAEPVPAPNPKANHFPLPSQVISGLKKEGSLDKFAPIVKILNENLELSLQTPALNPTKIKGGDYTGKLLDMPFFIFQNVGEVTKTMDADEAALREKLGFSFESITDIPGLFLHTSGADCSGWNYVGPTINPPLGEVTSDHAIGSRSVVFTGEIHLGIIIEAQTLVLTSKAKYYKRLQENFHAMMRENGVEPGTDITKMRGESAEKMAWASLGNVLDNYINNLEKVMTKIKKDKPRGKSYSLAPALGKPNYKPAINKKSKEISFVAPSNTLISKGKLNYAQKQNMRSYTA